MFVKKDLRKIPEILRDHAEKKDPCRDLHLSKRKSEFRGSVRVLCEQAVTDSKDDDGEATPLSEVQSLSLYDCEISDVRGISRAVPRLQELSLGRNPLDSLADVGGLVDLKKLWLDDCKLTAVDSLMSLTSLEELRLSHNCIESLPADLGDRLYALRVLSVDHNQLTELPPSLALLSSLEILQCRQNQLRELPQLLPTSLRILHASSNQIASLPESLFAGGGCPKLSHVYLNSNRLTKFAFDKLPRTLERLNLANNRIDDIPEGWRNNVGHKTGILKLDSNGTATGDKERMNGEDDEGVVTIILRDNAFLDDLQNSNRMDIE